MIKKEQSFVDQIKKFILFFAPPSEWKIPLIIISGVIFGLAFYILTVSKAFSYLSDKPEVCMNCHVMTTQYATWFHSKHRITATCNDCHVPQDNVAKKYLFKAMDGLRHSFMFTFRLEPQVIKIKEAGIKAVRDNCVRCHEVLVHKVNIQPDKLCWDCHKTVPHGSVNSLASTPYARVPKLDKPIPKWLENLIFEK